MSGNWMQDDRVSGRLYDSAIMARLWRYIVPYRGLLVAGVFLVVAGMGMFLVNPWILGRTVDFGIKPKNSEVITRLAVLYAVVELLVFAFAALQAYVLKYIGQKVTWDIRQELFSHLQRMPMAFFDRNPVGRLVTRLTNDVSAMAELFSSGIIVVIGDMFLLLGISALLLNMNVRLALGVMLVMPLLIGGAVFFQTRLRESFRRSKTALARVNSAASESLSGIRVTQLFNQEAVRAAKFAHLNADHREAQLLSVFYHSLMSPYVTVVNALAIVLILALGGTLVSHGEMTIGVLVSFLAYAQYFFFPIREIAEKVSVFQNAMASSERVFALLDEPEEDRAGEVPVAEGLSGNLAFEKVTFGYRPDRLALVDVSFFVASGESVAIVGNTGAGKTTVASLLNKSYEGYQGTILLDGRDLKSLDRTALRRKLLVVQQEVFLFAGSILENIRLGDSSVSEEKAWAAALETGAASFIEHLPGRLQFEIMERGTNLSAGQRQLLALTRVLCSRPEILVLDEATSSIDTASEQLIQSAISRLIRGRTSLIIAHRLSTIRTCSRILVFHKGHLVEEGNHSDLMAKKGKYFRLYQLQFQD